MDEVIELDLPWHPNGGDPNPYLLANENGPTMIVYRTAKSAPTEQPFAVLRFPSCQIVKFGYPNDEALAGHPLYSKGLSHYSIYEVLNSSWEEALSIQNLVAFPNPNSSARSSRHFVVTFHDSTFECIAHHIEGRFASTFKDAVRTKGAMFTSA